MKQILILGAGKSSSWLIKYLSQQAEIFNWEILVSDQSESAALEKTKGLPRTSVVVFHSGEKEQLDKLIHSATLVISMLPPSMHFEVAQGCLLAGKPLITASYLTTEIFTLNEEAKRKGIAILMEMGLDPGIDHMSAMKEIDAIHGHGGLITSFKSYTGGLIAPESDDNPWNYKITWNPRNVVLAGQGTVQYLASGSYKYIPYQSVFSRLHHLNINNYGEFEGYANRDSLKYIQTYGLEHSKTFIRGTLRRPGYCAAWNVLVKAGFTDDSFVIENSKDMTYLEFTKSFLPENSTHAEIDFYNYFEIDPTSDLAEKIKWLGLFSEDKVSIHKATPAQILQELIEKKWKLHPADKDMIVMQHEIMYELENKTKKLTATLVQTGENTLYTAMAKTVGLPMGIAAKLLLTGKFNMKGVHIPVNKEIYTPILEELKSYNIDFITEEKFL